MRPAFSFYLFTSPVMNKTFPILLLILAGIAACHYEKPAEATSFAFTESDSLQAARFNILRYFSQEEADTLLVDAVTFIGRKPVLATSESRFHPKFRSYYAEYSRQFSFFLYHIDTDSVHAFYMLRPARSLDGNTRGVLGQYTLDENKHMIDFIEILNTRVRPKSELKKIGLILFEALLEKGHVDDMISDTAMVEWPDDRLKYDHRRNEWRYDVE